MWGTLHSSSGVLREALRACHERLGVETVRAHAILCDDLGVYREECGQPVHDFSGVDRVYDTLLHVGLRPVVELSFMPRDLARDPNATVFAYEAIISPPKDYGRWADLVRDLEAHLVDRYGLEEIRDSVELRGLERSQPGSVLERHAGGVLSASGRRGSGVGL